MRDRDGNTVIQPFELSFSQRSNVSAADSSVNLSRVSAISGASASGPSRRHTTGAGQKAASQPPSVPQQRRNLFDAPPPPSVLPHTAPLMFVDVNITPEVCYMVCLRSITRACLYVCVCVCEYVCVCLFVCACERERERVRVNLQTAL